MLRFNIKTIKQLTSKTSYFIVCEATYFGPKSYNSPRTPDATLTPPTSHQQGTYFDVLRSIFNLS